MKTLATRKKNEREPKKTYATLEEFTRAKLNDAIKSLEGVDLTPILGQKK
jgi:hypothetical protein